MREGEMERVSGTYRVSDLGGRLLVDVDVPILDLASRSGDAVVIQELVGLGQVLPHLPRLGILVPRRTGVPVHGNDPIRSAVRVLLDRRPVLEK